MSKHTIDYETLRTNIVLHKNTDAVTKTIASMSKDELNAPTFDAPSGSAIRAFGAQKITLLELATDSANQDVVNLLIKAKVKVDRPLNSKGDTVVDFAQKQSTSGGGNSPSTQTISTALEDYSRSQKARP